jgi:predicted metal-dependent phosphoesterase TrpH
MSQSSATTHNGTIQVDLHIHTCYSGDTLTSLEEVIAAVQKRGLGAVAITDHNAIAGALELQRLAPFPVIAAEEVLTNEGEIIGLFLNEFIPPGLTPAETVAHIHAQGGLVYVPHPFDGLRDSALHEPALMSILHQVDVLEVLNARVIRPAHNERAQRLAQEYHLPGGAGSDAHTAFEIGQAYLEMQSFADRDEFLRNLASARVCGHLSSPAVHLFTRWAKLQKWRSRA